MTRLTWFEGFILLAFWMAGLTAFFLGGLPWVGYVVQAFLAVILWWVGRQVVLECIVTVKEQLRISRDKIKRSRDWRQIARLNPRRKGMA